MTIRYVGGKTKYADDILAVILPGNEHREYWEPFVGSAAMLVRVPPTMRRFANDKNPFLIAMHEAVRCGWVPPSEVSEEQYKHIKQHPSQYPKELIGFVSIACSFGAKVWGTFARDQKGISSSHFAAKSIKAVTETIAPLQGVSLMSMDYQELCIPDGALVYCDPPYAGTTDYGNYTTQVGDFWRWCNKLIARDCQVFVSGYRNNKPSAWEIVWSTEVKVSIANNNNKTMSKWTKIRVECLFKPKQMHIDHLKAGTICKCSYEAADWAREAALCQSLKS